MGEMAEIAAYPHLKPALISYLVLGITDTVHHLHAAIALGQTAAFHAVAAGLVLVPVALFSVRSFVRHRKTAGKWVFLAIAALAILLPGLYHGGWDHLVKVLGFLRIESDATRIGALFPPGDFHYWIYEISGASEFFMALACLYCTYDFVRKSP